MRTLLLFLPLWLIAVSQNAQQLTGVVFDRENNEPVMNAHVYIEGSSLHDVTNLDGKFDITINSVVNLPLVITHVMYQTTTVSNPFSFLPDTIFVEEKINLLGEVTVQPERYSRRQLLRAFRREFLGNSLGAASCIIENEEKIEIWFNSLTHTLSASCDEPVLINNRYLGYQIYLTLEKFKVEYPGRLLGVGFPLQVSLEGSVFFEDLTPSNQTIAKRRENAFTGSPPHFLRLLAHEQLISADYILHGIQDRTEVEPRLCFIVHGFSGNKQVRVTPRLKPDDLVFSTYHGRLFFGEIGVKRNRTEVSRVIFFKDTLLIDDWGNLSNPDDVLFMGHMGHFRMGDQLPADYVTTRLLPLKNPSSGSVKKERRLKY